MTLQIFSSEPGDDIALMTRVVSGDRVASQALVERLQARVQRVSRALLRNESDAKDASQLSLVSMRANSSLDAICMARSSDAGLVTLPPPPACCVNSATPAS